MAEGEHPVPFRTRKLSPPAPMVLPWQRGGRVGRRRDIVNEGPPRTRGAFVVSAKVRHVPRPPGDRARGRPHARPRPSARSSGASRRGTGTAATGRTASRATPTRGSSGSRESPRPAKGAAGRSLVDQVRAMARPGQGDRAAKAFELAADLLQRGRDKPALTAAEEAKALAPRSGPVREVLGMALYRNERYREALRELQAYRRITGRPDQNHLIADAYRALGM